MNKQRQIIIRDKVNIRPHEIKTAQVLADAGYTVEFIRKSEEDRVTSPDIFLEGVAWEIKSPTSNKLRAVERNLRKAVSQSQNIVFDSRRMKGLPNAAIQREVRKYASEIRSIKHLKYIDNRGNLIDIC